LEIYALNEKLWEVELCWDSYYGKFSFSLFFDLLSIGCILKISGNPANYPHPPHGANIWGGTQMPPQIFSAEFGHFLITKFLIKK